MHARAPQGLSAYPWPWVGQQHASLLKKKPKKPVKHDSLVLDSVHAGGYKNENVIPGTCIMIIKILPGAVGPAYYDYIM